MSKEMLTILTQIVVLVYFLLLIIKEFKKPKAQDDEKERNEYE